MQDVLPDAGSTSYKDKLAVPVLVQLVFWLNDLYIHPPLPLFLGTLDVLVHVRMHWGGNR